MKIPLLQKDLRKATNSLQNPEETKRSLDRGYVSFSYPSALEKNCQKNKNKNTEQRPINK